MKMHTTISFRSRSARPTPGLVGRGWLLALAWLLFAALAPVARAAGDSPAVQARDAYVRAVPPGQGNTAAFMHLANPTSQALALVAASTSAAKVVELHTHVREDGMMKMRRIERIEVPARGEVVLRPGGLHLMLIGLRQPLAPGDAVDLRLLFDNDSALDLTAEVRTVMRQGMTPGSGAGHAVAQD